jgi:hypothetical protein
VTAGTLGRGLAASVVLLALGGLPGPAHAQVFLASRAHPEFAIGPLFILASVRPELGPVAVRVSWSLALPLNARADDFRQDLYLVWPAEVSGPTASGAADEGLQRFVEERGFAAVSTGRLALAARDRGKLGTPAPSDPIAATASFVTFYKRGTNPAQTGVGTFIKIPWTPVLADPISLLSLTLTLKDLITTKPATWIEELFWGRRYVLNLSAGSAGSVALYSMYFDQRDRVVRLARDFSVLVADFADADHLRIEEISPAAATRRPSRTRAGAETVTLALAGAEGNVAQVLTVRFSYFSGWVPWRPILISLLLLAVGNLMGAFMFTRQVARLFRRRFLVGSADGAGPQVGVLLPRETLERLVPGQTTHAEVLRLCGAPSEERERRRSAGRRTLVYRATRRVPHRGLRLGWLATVRRWDEEDHEVEIDFEDDRVSEVETRIRRSRAP